MSNDNWKSWCRLCSKRNASIDIFIKDENFYCLSEAIEKFLSISISSYDEAPTKICLSCHEILTSLINFSHQSSKVQEMFSELTLCDKFEPITDFESLREKYGLKFDMNTNTPDPNNLSSTSIDNKKGSTRKLRRTKRRLINKGRSKFVFEEDYEDNEISAIDLNKNYESNQENKINFTEDDPEDLKPLNCIQLEINNDNIKSEIVEMNEIKRTKRRKIIVSKEDKTNNKQPIIFCETCDKGFTSKASYAIHLKAIHQIVKDQTESHACSTCGKTFQKLSKLRAHENIHLPPDERKWYPCPQCDKKFAIEGSIKMHIRTVHVKEKCFVCEECGKSFATVDGLNSHKIVHTDETPFQCPKCDKKFKRLPSLKNHIDSHEDTKYICPICGVVLNTKTILRRHMVIHSDEKKYKCNFCGAAFKRAKALKNHLILHTGLKPYQCPFCDQTFANGSNCRKHQKNSHPVELAQMEERGEKRICKNVPRLEHLKAVNDAAVMMADASNLFPQPVRKIIKMEQIDMDQNLQQALNSQLISDLNSAQGMLVVPVTDMQQNSLLEFNDIHTNSNINASVN